MTISFIYNTITKITNRIINFNKINLKKIDFTNLTIVFNNNIAIENSNNNYTFY
jgi:hypothetical protein